MKALAAIGALVASFFISIVVMQYGWGLQPQNWGWIFGGFTAMVFVHIVVAAIKE